MNKILKTSFLSIIICILVCLNRQTVLADETSNTIISIQREQSQDGICCVCKMENGNAITSGKLRIAYDAKQLKLVKTEAGEALSGALCEINDCLTGNKAEGEIVVAFASSETISDGNLVKLSFEKQEGVTETDKITINVKAENVAGDNGEVDVTTKNLTFTLDGKTQTSEEQTSNNQTSNKQNSKENSSSTSKKNTNNTSTNTSTKNGSTTKTGNAKTGDDTNIIPFILSGVVAGIVIILLVKRQKRQ